MFCVGHMLYELATCQPLETVFPTDEQRERIADTEVRKLLKFIFKTSGTKMKHTLEEVRLLFHTRHEFKYLMLELLSTLCTF